MSRYIDSSLMSGLGRRRRVHRRRGRGIVSMIKSALPFIKRSGLVSHLAGRIPRIGSHLGAFAKSHGWGRRRVHRRRTTHRKRRVGRGFWSDFGNGFMSVIKPVHDVIKSTGLVSKGLALTGNPALGAVAGTLGYGRRRRVHRRRRVGGMSGARLAVMRSLLGAGRRKRHTRRHGRGILL